MTNPKKNFIYNLIYQLLILVCPLITTPYLSRIIGSNGIGIYSYTYSIVYYFMLFTLLGVNNYGNRTIAKVRDDEKKLSQTFWEIYFIQLIMGIIMLVIYFIFIFIIKTDYQNISLLASMFIISSVLDINWFFFGIEDFKKTIARNTIVKVMSVILVFMFVKSYNDVWKYMLIMSSSTVISQLVMWYFLLTKIQYSKPTFSNIKQHIKPNLILFIPVIAVSLYKMMDKIMLGLLANTSEVGFYENAEKIINIPMIFITALGTVMLPRMSNIIEKGNINESKKYIDKSIKFALFISCSMCCGLISVSNNFVPIYFGNEFLKSSTLIKLLSITLPFVSFANVIRTQYLIPNEKDNIFIKSVVLGAISNFIINYILIKHLASIGACIGTIIAEIVVMLYQTIAVRKELPIKQYVKESFNFIIKSIIMLLIIYPLNNLKINKIIIIIVQIILGVVIYFILNYKYVCSVINIKKNQTI